MASVLLVVLALLIIVAFTVLEARAERALWRKSRRRESRRKVQQQITWGKSHTR